MKITKTSKNGIELIKKYEGFRSKPYLCPANSALKGSTLLKKVNANDISAMQDILNKGTDSLEDKNKRR